MRHCVACSSKRHRGSLRVSHWFTSHDCHTLHTRHTAHCTLQTPCTVHCCQCVTDMAITTQHTEHNRIAIESADLNSIESNRIDNNVNRLLSANFPLEPNVNQRAFIRLTQHAPRRVWRLVYRLIFDTLNVFWHILGRSLRLLDSLMTNNFYVFSLH